MTVLLPICCAALRAAPGAAGYLTPEQAGFADCMLIYEAPSRPAEALLPYVARTDGRPGWLFDAFLFCRFGAAPSGADYYNGPTNKADWLHALDEWFAPGRDVRALQEAITEARRTLGAPPHPRKVILSLHYPSRSQHDFGDVDGDARSEDLSDPAGRAKAVAWHIDEAARRFAEAACPDLELWGFYWMNEDAAGADREMVRQAADLVHARGYRLLWIPYYRAAGFDQWRELGFDAAILQPNYAFLEQHEGRIRNDRLLETADLARSLGMGVEIEAGSVVTDPRAREMFLDYLAFGSPALCGYQRAAKAYYQETELFRELSVSKDPDARAAYDAVCAFVRGAVVPRSGLLKAALAPELAPLADGRFRSPFDPEAPVYRPGGAPVTLELTAPMRVEELELSFVREPRRRVGQASLEVRSAVADTWRPAGWATVSLPPTTEGQAWTYVRALPVANSDVAAMRVRLDFADGFPRPAVDEISVVTRASPGARQASGGGIAVGCPYSVEPDSQRAYPDRGGMLTDGEVATAGWSQGKSVGWYGTGATIVLDLGEDRSVDQIVVHCDGGGYGAVRFPDAVIASVYSGADSPSLSDAGLGAPPPAPAAIASAGPADVEIAWQRAVADGLVDASGTLRLRLPGAPVRARWVCLSLAQPAWLMVSEIEVLEGEVNRALGAAYRVLPQPTARPDARYADDGRLLTDGFVADGFLAPRVVGWADQTATVTIDLGSTREVAEVRTHALGGGLYGIFAPRSVSVRVSADGREWRTVGTAEVEDPGGSSCQHVVASVRVGGPARFVRVIAESSRGWLMLSEIEVR